MVDNELKIEYGDSMMYGGDPDKIDFGGLVPNSNPLDVNYPRPDIGDAMSAHSSTYKGVGDAGRRTVSIDKQPGSATIRRPLDTDVTVRTTPGGFASSGEAAKAASALRNTAMDISNPAPTLVSEKDFLQTGVDPAMARVENMAKRAGM